MIHSPNYSRTITWSRLRHAIQIAAVLLFTIPFFVAGWSLFGATSETEDSITTPAQLPFFGSLSSSTFAEITLLDPFGMLQVVVASKAFHFDWLFFALPVVVFYTLIRARAFCGWICPVNLLLEGVDAVRKKLSINVCETPLNRHIKIGVSAGVLLLSALVSVPVFEVVSPISALNKGLLFGSLTGFWLLAVIIILELFWGHRVWCRSLCPLGGFYQVLGRMGMVKVVFRREACIHCDACKNACLADPLILDPVLTKSSTTVCAGDCMICGACVDACPTRALALAITYRT